MDSQSKMDLLCNPALISETFKSRRSMKLKSNIETVVGNHKEKMAGYHKHIWFSKRAITNIIALSNIIHKYRVTYNNEDKMFIFQREVEDKPNMEFRMHKIRLNYYDPLFFCIHQHCLWKQGGLHSEKDQERISC